MQLSAEERHTNMMIKPAFIKTRDIKNDSGLSSWFEVIASGRIIFKSVAPAPGI